MGIMYLYHLLLVGCFSIGIGISISMIHYLVIGIGIPQINVYIGIDKTSGIGKNR